MTAVAVPRVRVADLLELTKPRIVVMVMLTAAAGYCVAARPVDLVLLGHILLGTALVAGGTNALNQVAEREADALMRRTRGRPVPAGRVSVPQAWTMAWSAGLLGVAYLWLMVSDLVGLLAAATLVSYVYLYTPLKRRTSVSTLVGAVPGALPILGGWAAATGTVSFGGWVLFWILFLWQLPHFLALGWLYREDYARAGFKMLSVADASGRVTFGYASLYAAALLPVSLAPTFLGLTGAVYFAGAAVLSAAFLWSSATAARRSSAAGARRLFRMSLAYLPVLLTLMVLNRTV